MDGENNGSNPIEMDDFGGPPLFLETPSYCLPQIIAWRVVLVVEHLSINWFALSWSWKTHFP